MKKNTEPKSQEEIDDEKMLRRVFFIYIPLFGVVFGSLFGVLLSL